ncbi:lipocalin-like domain-containing protein [Vibrio parahaemolyticus]|uniref:lipocalin-like domain-containing protein n=1 Tax=Vibrio mediterranei TaxID=689 RepID=UPI0040681634
MRRCRAWIVVVPLLLSACEDKQSQSFGSWLGESEQQYQVVSKGHPITFPADHMAHDRFRHEWWYLTANLFDEQGTEMGIQWTQFRVAIDAQQSGDNTPWSGQQIYMAHSAVTSALNHVADEKWSRVHPQLAGVEASPFRVFLDDWQWVSQSEDLFPATLTVASEKFGYTLELESNAPYQLQGQNGYSQKSANGEVASYYYSQPFITVRGTVTLNGKLHKVKGRGWIDREWSSQFLLDSQQGWDWFALRLDEQTSLVLFQLRDAQSGEASYAQGRIMGLDGTGTTIDQEEITLSEIRRDTVDGRQYPTQWRVEIPAHGIALTVSALNPEAKMPLTVPYWEGPVRIDGSHTGTGYMELTGY